MAKQNLAQLRSALKIFRSKVSLGREEDLADVEYKFFFQGADDEESTGISEACFFAAPGDDSGHPQIGTYHVRATNTGTGQILFDDKGVWQERKESSGDDATKSARDSIADTARKIAVAAGVQVDNNRMESIRLRDAVKTAEEEARVARLERHDLALSIKTLEDEALQLTRQRDEAYVVRDRAAEERDAIATELEAFRQRGGELRPFAEAAVSKGIDRLAEIFEVHNPAVHRETFEECQSSLVEDLMARRLSDMISLAHAGEIEWASLRYLIWSYYQVDPGPEPVDPDWQPPSVKTEESETQEPPPQGDVH